MNITLNEEESASYVAAMREVTLGGITFGTFITEALKFKTKIKSRDSIIAELKTLLAASKPAIDLPEPAVPKQTAVHDIPTLYASQRVIHKEFESAHEDGLSVIMGAAPTSITVHTTKEAVKTKVKLKSRLAKADKYIFDTYASEPVKARCEVNNFANNRGLSPLTVIRYVEHRSEGKYKIVKGKDLLHSEKHDNASIHKEVLYFTKA